MKVKLKKKVVAPAPEKAAKEKTAPAKTAVNTKNTKKAGAKKATAPDETVILELTKTMTEIENMITSLKEKYDEARKALACEKYSSLKLGEKYDYRTDKSVIHGVLRYRNSPDDRNNYFELQVIKKDGSLSETVRVVLDPDSLTPAE